MTTISCKYCLKAVLDNCNCIYCEICNSWCHIKCIKMSLSRLKELSESKDPFYCNSCLSHELPFCLLTTRTFDVTVNCTPDVSINKFKFPCKLCKQACKSNQNCIYCEICKMWIHVKCSALSLSQFKSYTTNTLPYFCSDCIFDNLPINCLDLPDHSELQGHEGYISLDNLNLHFDNYADSDLVILHVNTRSLNKNVNLLEDLICRIKYQPDVVAITETRLNINSNLDLVSLSGYNLFNIDSLTQAGGVALYIKSHLSAILRNDIVFHDIDLESIWVEINYNNVKLKNIIIGVVYRHPQSSISGFSDKFSAVLSQISLQNKDVFITGDFNIDSLKVESNEYVCNYFDMISSHGFANVIELPTRITESSKTSIDHFYHNCPSKVLKSSILCSDMSDHLPLLVTIKNSSLAAKQQCFTIRNYKNLDNNDTVFLDASLSFDNLKVEFANVNESVNDKFLKFTSAITDVLNKHAPLRKLSRKETKLKLKPWITAGIRNSMKTRDKMFKNLCKCSFSNKPLHDKYKKYRNYLTRLKEKSKRNHFWGLLSNAKGDSKKVWQVINDVRKKTKSSLSLPEKLVIGDKIINSERDILNCLNIHFSTIGSHNTKESISLDKATHFIKPQLNSIILEPVSEVEVASVISNLNSRKASGADEISVKLIQKLNKIICPVLTSLINESFSSGVYPNCLKMAKVIPVYKGGSREDAGNYRPISLLSNINKVVEKVIYSRLFSFFEKFKIINSCQFGFREGYSTAMAVADFYESVINSNDKGKAVCAVLLDLSKAFDSVNRDILLFKLYKYGIRGTAWSLLHSYLSDREQFIANNNSVSKNVKVEVGVPQGSVLGPLLFLIHINDLAKCTSLKVLNFADDTLLYSDFESPLCVDKVLNDELKKVTQWLNDNKLKLNCTKTKYLVFSPKSNKFNSLKSMKLCVNSNQEIERVKQYKYLGVMLDEKLTWKPHLKLIKSKLSKSLGLLYRNRRYLDKRSLMLIFHSLFCSHLSYGILCWGRCSRSSMQPLQVLLNKAIKCINFKKINTSEKETLSIFHEDRVLTVYDMFKIELGKFMFKYHKGLLPCNFKNYFMSVSSVHSYSTRTSTANYFLPRKIKSQGLCGLSYLGAKLWSGVPDTIKNRNTLSSFSKSYKKELLNKYVQ